MTGSDSKMAREVFDLRIQVNALEVLARNTSIPALVKEVRGTIRWSACIIAAALVASSTLKYCADERAARLEKRVEILEKRPAPLASP